jgi:hypothetical protein
MLDRLNECGDRRVAIDERGQLIGRLAVRLDHRRALVSGPMGGPQRRAVRAEQHDLGDLAAERLERLGQEALDRLGDLG